MAAEERRAACRLTPLPRWLGMTTDTGLFAGGVRSVAFVSEMRPRLPRSVRGNSVALQGTYRPTAAAFFNQTSRIAMSAGVTPEIREAWPMESGRKRFSFWRDSIRNETILS